MAFKNTTKFVDCSKKHEWKRGNFHLTCLTKTFTGLNITITEHLTPKKKAKVTPIVNGVNSAEDLTSIVFQDPSKNIVKSLQKGDQVNKCSGILQNPSNHLSILKRTTNSPSELSLNYLPYHYKDFDVLLMKFFLFYYLPFHL
jgi:hypothetical protein